MSSLTGRIAVPGGNGGRIFGEAAALRGGLVRGLLQDEHRLGHLLAEQKLLPQLLKALRRVGEGVEKQKVFFGQCVHLGSSFLSLRRRQNPERGGSCRRVWPFLYKMWWISSLQGQDTAVFAQSLLLFVEAKKFCRSLGRKGGKAEKTRGKRRAGECPMRAVPGGV